MLRGLARFSAGFATVCLRLSSYIFLRWIPSHVLWPAVIFFWIQFILSFIYLLYIDLEPSEPVVAVETTDIIEVVGNGGDKAVVETEIDTITIEPAKQARPVSWMETVYLGIPGPSPLLSFATTAVNAALLMMTLDLTFRTYLFYPATDLAFHRPVPTSPYSANIFIRSPDEQSHPLQIFYKPVQATNWLAGPTVSDFDNETDFTTTVALNGLRPNTEYGYAVIPHDTDIDTANKTAFGKFETFPPVGKRGRWSFGSSSCIKPGLPYNPVGHPLRIQGLEYLEKDIPNLKFFAFLGDFIYADVPHKPASTPESYFMQYRQVYSSPSFKEILPNLPMYHVHDDHDIANDYDQGDQTSLYKNATQPFHAYQRNVNPAPVHPDVNYFTMDFGDTSFFFLDTRRYRTSNLAEDGPEKTMLGERQLNDLIEWLKGCENRGIVWKFIISSVPMTDNWKGPDGQRDTWGGFMYERSIILDVIENISNVVVISGDRHEAAVTALPNEVIEVSISPLNQFYIPIRTYHSSDTDQQIAYFPEGNEKYAVYTIDTTNTDQPLLEVQLKIKGGTVWKHVFAGKKVGGTPTIEKGRTAIEKAWGWIERLAWQQPE